MANQFLALALFLMMLSFFIILNGVSSYDTEREKLVLSSVSQAFSNKTRETALAPKIEATIVQGIHTGDSLSQLEGLLSSHIANFQANKNKLGTMMQVSLSYEEFDKAMNEKNSEDGAQAFLPTMISLLRSEKSGVPYKVDIVLNMPADPIYIFEESPQTYAENLQRAADVAATLEQAGMPQKLLSAGLAKGNAGMVDLTFTRYEEYDPLKGDVK